MARWDQILSLPVQNPPTLEFSAFDITWSRVEGYRGQMDRLALIPFSRVNDFVRGESNNKECPTRFHVEARRRRPPESSNKLKVDGILEYILYWCSFGPDDHRKGGTVRPSRNYGAKRKSPAGRPNTKRGCVSHFIVKRLVAEPTVALVIYNHDKHVDKNKMPCHGPMDTKAVGTRAMFAPYISEDLRLQVMSLLYVGVPVETIYQKHIELVEKQGGPSNRDDLLTHRCIRRIERKIRRASFELDSDDDASVTMWVENHWDCIFFYEDFSDAGAFSLGIQTEWQLQQMIRFGNCRLLASDSKFGTNKLKYTIHSVLVFDHENTAIPVAWILTTSCANSDTYKWMRALYDRVRSKDPTWQLGGYIVDDPLADIRAIREIFQCSVLLSFWRVRHIWHKKLIERCPQLPVRVMLAKRLGEELCHVCKGNGDINSFKAVLEDFIDCSNFLDYFRAIWFLRLGPWITSLKEIPTASTQLSASVESYHYQLKLRLLNEINENVYRRADWLVDKLATKVHSFYWLDYYPSSESFTRYWKDEWKRSANPWREALQIADSDVSIESNCASVACFDDEEKHYVVYNPGSLFPLCDCSWAGKGNICKHAIKLATFYRRQKMAEPSLGFLTYNEALLRILNCTSQDSIIRDHAVSLAVNVRAQIAVVSDYPSDTSEGSFGGIIPAKSKVSQSKSQLIRAEAVESTDAQYSAVSSMNTNQDGITQCVGSCAAVGSVHVKVGEGVGKDAGSGSTSICAEGLMNLD